MSSQTKRIPKNSIIIVIKFDSKDQVIDMLQQKEYQEAFASITNLSLIQGGKCEYFKSFSS
jgi:uncharacterized protein (DUF1330 family)